MLDDAAAKFPNAAVIHIYKGQFMERTGQLSEAAASYDMAHKVEPHNSMPLIHKGLMMMQSNVVEGVKLLEQAVTVEPDCFPALQQLGQFITRYIIAPLFSKWRVASQHPRVLGAKHASNTELIKMNPFFFMIVFHRPHCDADEGLQKGVGVV